MEELGDVIFILIFIATLYERDRSLHSLTESLKHITAKMIRRHPHVFRRQAFQGYRRTLGQLGKDTKREGK